MTRAEIQKDSGGPSAAATLRGADSGQFSVFTLQFNWTEPMRTSLHKHIGWELVLVHKGQLRAVIDERAESAQPGQFIDLPAGSEHAIWSDGPVTFEVLGQTGLGLWMIVPDDHLKRREVPIYDREGPWRMDPPPGTEYTTSEETDRLRKLSQTLLEGRIPSR